MRWKGGRRSSNVDDRRGQGAGHSSAGAAPVLLRFLPALVRTKTGRTILIVAVIAIFGSRMLGIDLLPLLLGGGGATVQQADYQPTAEEEELVQFVSVVLADTEDTWNTVFAERGGSYKEPTLVLFTDRVNSACGMAGAAMGPFYCPGDQKLYIDLSFFRDLAQRHGAPGDFAQAYVVAHEIGHHVQNLLGITSQVHNQRGKISKEAYNELSVRLELQADFLAGMWAHHIHKMKGTLEKGDFEEAMSAAQAIGDDNIQKRSQGYVVPESFTHGTSEQRMRWFRKGVETGDLRQGDTFNARPL